MRNALRALALLFLLTIAWCSAERTQRAQAREPPAGTRDPVIVVTINPESRVSVAIAGALPPVARCGTTVDLPVKIINQGFVTARPEAQLVDTRLPDVTVTLDPEPLKGLPEETRILHIKLVTPGQTDLTVVFRTHNEMLDLGGRDRVHFLMQCHPAATTPLEAG